jgi:chromate transport protein ChrA
MMFEEWLDGIAHMLGVTVQEAGMVMAVVFTMIVVLAVSSRTTNASALSITAISMLVLFTAAGWIPIWIMIVIGIIAGYFLAKELSKQAGISGGGGT